RHRTATGAGGSDSRASTGGERGRWGCAPDPAYVGVVVRKSGRKRAATYRGPGAHVPAVHGCNGGRGRSTGGLCVRRWGLSALPRGVERGGGRVRAAGSTRWARGVERGRYSACRRADPTDRGLRRVAG